MSAMLLRDGNDDDGLDGGGSSAMLGDPSGFIRIPASRGRRRGRDGGGGGGGWEDKSAAADESLDLSLGDSGSDGEGIASAPVGFEDGSPSPVRPRPRPEDGSPFKPDGSRATTAAETTLDSSGSGAGSVHVHANGLCLPAEEEPPQDLSGLTDDGSAKRGGGGGKGSPLSVASLARLRIQERRQAALRADGDHVAASLFASAVRRADIAREAGGAGGGGAGGGAGTGAEGGAEGGGGGGDPNSPWSTDSDSGSSPEDGGGEEVEKCDWLDTSEEVDDSRDSWSASSSQSSDAESAPAPQLSSSPPTGPSAEIAAAIRILEESNASGSPSPSPSGVRRWGGEPQYPAPPATFDEEAPFEDEAPLEGDAACDHGDGGAPVDFARARLLASHPAQEPYSPSPMSCISTSTSYLNEKDDVVGALPVMVNGRLAPGQLRPSFGAPGPFDGPQLPAGAGPSSAPLNNSFDPRRMNDSFDPESSRGETGGSDEYDGKRRRYSYSYFCACSSICLPGKTGRVCPRSLWIILFFAVTVVGTSAYLLTMRGGGSSSSLEPLEGSAPPTLAPTGEAMGGTSADDSRDSGGNFALLLPTPAPPAVPSTRPAASNIFVEGAGLPILEFIGACERKGPCGPCQGDCDDDADCLPGLVCFMTPGDGDKIEVPDGISGGAADDITDDIKGRDTGETWVPGCRGTVNPRKDYCVVPPLVRPTAAPTILFD